MQTNSFFVKAQRGIAAVSLMAFIVTNYLTVPAGAAVTAPLSANPALLAKELNSIKIPNEIGKIEDVFKGRGNEVVVLIQDAHAIPEAQRNIQKLIHYFQKEYGLGLVGVEGASSELDPQIFKSFPDKEVLKKTFDEYLAKGELTGSTAAAIFSAEGIPAGQGRETVYRGLEDWSLYQEALGLYLRAMRKEPEIKKKLEVGSLKLEEEKKRVYSKELFEIDRLLSDFRHDHTDLISVLRRLSLIQRPAQGSELEIILREAERSRTIQPAVELEVKKIAEQIAALLRDEKKLEVRTRFREGIKKSFNQKFQEFQTSQISTQAFALFLKELTVKNHLPITISSGLASSIKDQKRMRDIEGTRFFRDFEQYVRAVKAGLFKNEAEKKLDRKSRRLNLLEKLARLELSREEWEELKKNVARDAWHVTRDEKVIPGSSPHVLGGDLETHGFGNDIDFSSHFAFYENALRRDEVFFKNLQNLLKTYESRATRHASPSTALLVAGGFHTEGLTQRLKEKGISYLLLRPEIGAVPEKTSYRDQMQGGVSWKNYFEVENGKIDLYKAFVRGTRDRLLQMSGASPVTSGAGFPESRDTRHDSRLLKNWRDQIIRDLADKKQIAKTKNYTRFIDEIVQPQKDAVKPEWIVKLDRFIAGLKQLDANHAVSEQNILNLLKLATVLQYTGNASASPGALLDEAIAGLRGAVRAPINIKPSVAPYLPPVSAVASTPRRSEMRALDEKPGKLVSRWRRLDGSMLDIREAGNYSQPFKSIPGFEVYPSDGKKALYYYAFDNETGTLHQMAPFPGAGPGISLDIFNKLASDMQKENKKLQMANTINPKMVTLLGRVGKNLEIEMKFGPLGAWGAADINDELADPERILGADNSREIFVYDKYGMTLGSMILKRGTLPQEYELVPAEVETGHEGFKIKDGKAFYGEIELSITEQETSKDGKLFKVKKIFLGPSSSEHNLPGVRAAYFVPVDRENPFFPYLANFKAVHPLTGQRFYKVRPPEIFPEKSFELVQRPEGLRFEIGRDEYSREIFLEFPPQHSGGSPAKLRVFLDENGRLQTDDKNHFIFYQDDEVLNLRADPSPLNRSEVRAGTVKSIFQQAEAEMRTWKMPVEVYRQSSPDKYFSHLIVHFAGDSIENSVWVSLSSVSGTGIYIRSWVNGKINESYDLQFSVVPLWEDISPVFSMLQGSIHFAAKGSALQRLNDSDFISPIEQSFPEQAQPIEFPAPPGNLNPSTGDRAEWSGWINRVIRFYKDSAELRKIVQAQLKRYGTTNEVAERTLQSIEAHFALERRQIEKMSAAERAELERKSDEALQTFFSRIQENGGVYTDADLAELSKYPSLSSHPPVLHIKAFYTKALAHVTADDSSEESVPLNQSAIRLYQELVRADWNDPTRDSFPNSVLYDSLWSAQGQWNERRLPSGRYYITSFNSRGEGLLWELERGQQFLEKSAQILIEEEQGSSEQILSGFLRLLWSNPAMWDENYTVLYETLSPDTGQIRVTLMAAPEVSVAASGWAEHLKEEFFETHSGTLGALRGQLSGGIRDQEFKTWVDAVPAQDLFMVERGGQEITEELSNAFRLEKGDRVILNARSEMRATPPAPQVPRRQFDVKKIAPRVGLFFSIFGTFAAGIALWRFFLISDDPYVFPLLGTSLAASILAIIFYFPGTPKTIGGEAKLLKALEEFLSIKEQRDEFGKYLTEKFRRSPREQQEFQIVKTEKFFAEFDAKLINLANVALELKSVPSQNDLTRELLEKVSVELQARLELQPVFISVVNILQERIPDDPSFQRHLELTQQLPVFKKSIDHLLVSLRSSRSEVRAGWRIKIAAAAAAVLALGMGVSLPYFLSEKEDAGKKAVEQQVEQQIEQQIEKEAIPAEKAPPTKPAIPAEPLETRLKTFEEFLSKIGEKDDEGKFRIANDDPKLQEAKKLLRQFVNVPEGYAIQIEPLKNHLMRVHVLIRSGPASKVILTVDFKRDFRIDSGGAGNLKRDEMPGFLETVKAAVQNPKYENRRIREIGYIHEKNAAGANKLFILMDPQKALNQEEAGKMILLMGDDRKPGSMKEVPLKSVRLLKNPDLRVVLLTAQSGSLLLVRPSGGFYFDALENGKQSTSVLDLSAHAEGLISDPFPAAEYLELRQDAETLIRKLEQAETKARALKILKSWKTQEDADIDRAMGEAATEKIAEAVVPLGQILKESGSKEHRLGAARALGNIGGQGVVALLAEALKKMNASDPNIQWVMVHTIEALGKTGRPEALEALLEVSDNEAAHNLILRDQGVFVLSNAFEGLAKSVGKDKAAEIFRAKLKTGTGKIQLTAAGQLTGLGFGTESVLPLTTLLKKEPGAGKQPVLSALGAALSGVKDKKVFELGVDALAGVIADEKLDYKTRKTALRSVANYILSDLAKKPHEGLMKILRQVSEKSASLYLRLDAGDVLSEIERKKGKSPERPGGSGSRSEMRALQPPLMRHPGIPWPAKQEILFHDEAAFEVEADPPGSTGATARGSYIRLLTGKALVNAMLLSQQVRRLLVLNLQDLGFKIPFDENALQSALQQLPVPRSEVRIRGEQDKKIERGKELTPLVPAGAQGLRASGVEDPLIKNAQHVFRLLVTARMQYSGLYSESKDRSNVYYSQIVQRAKEWLDKFNEAAADPQNILSKRMAIFLNQRAPQLLNDLFGVIEFMDPENPILNEPEESVSSMRDYYEVLGVRLDADPTAIKKAYRRLVREFHPDRKPGDKAAEAKFKEVQEAYDVLGDSEKRKAYDRLRSEARRVEQAQDLIAAGEAAQAFVRAMQTEEAVPQNEVRQAVQVTVSGGVRPVIEKLERIRQQLKERMNQGEDFILVGGVLVETVKVHALVQSLLQQLKAKMEGLSDVSYAVTYLIPKNESSASTLGRVIGRFSSRLGQVIFNKENGPSLPASVMGMISKSGLKPVFIPNLRRVPVFAAPNQSYVGFVGNDGAALGTEIAELFVPVILLQPAGGRTTDPLIEELEVTLQTAAALLVAAKIRQPVDKVALRPAAIALLQDIFPGFASLIVTPFGNGLGISGTGIEASLAALAARQESVSKSA